MIIESNEGCTVTHGTAFSLSSLASSYSLSTCLCYTGDSADSMRLLGGSFEKSLKTSSDE